MEELKVEPVDKKLRRYKLAITHNKNEQKQYATKKKLNCRPNGHRWLGKLMRRLSDRPKQVYYGLTCDRWWWWWWT